MLERFPCKAFEPFSTKKVQAYSILRLKSLALGAEIIASIQEPIDKPVIFQAVWQLASISRLIQQALFIELK
jgi:hypothetical protein